MKKVWWTVVWFWVLALVTGAVAIVLIILRKLGVLPTINLYAYLLGPLFCFLVAAAFLTTARAAKSLAAWGDPRKRALLQLANAASIGFACWPIVAGLLFLVRLFIPVEVAWPRLLASMIAMIVFLVGWRRVQGSKLLGLIPFAAFLFQFLRDVVLLARSPGAH